MLWGDVSASERKVCEWILKQKGLGLKKRDSNSTPRDLEFAGLCICADSFGAGNIFAKTTFR
jgi:hypothetical protein